MKKIFTAFLAIVVICILLGIGGDGLGHGWVFHCTCRWLGGESGGAEQPDAQAGDQ